jgi:hypothetical protein
LQHEQPADGRKVRFDDRSSRSKNWRIAFVTSGSMVDGLMAREGRVGHGGAATGGTTRMAARQRVRETAKVAAASDDTTGADIAT